MKTRRLVLLLPALLLMNFSSVAPELTRAERQFATKLLTETRDNLLKKVKGLSQNQLNFKADENSWSVAQCMEHIAITESMIFGMVTGAQEGEADPSKHDEVKMTDEEIVGMITDRSHKIKTQEPMEPKNSFGSFEGSVKEFTTKRNEHINYIKTTNDDLRNHYNEFPFGLADTYQTVLFLAGHSKRHTMQIEEVMANPNFPKK